MITVSASVSGTASSVPFVHVPDGEAVSLHDGAVVVLMGFAEFGRHGGFVVQVRKAGIGIQCAGVQNRLRGLFDFRLLRVRGVRLREVVVNDIFRVTIIAF